MNTCIYIYIYNTIYQIRACTSNDEMNLGLSGARQFAVLDFGLAVRADKWRREWGAGRLALA